MAYALVGTPGVVTPAAASVTPTFGTGESRTAGNLLICWAVDTGNVNPPTDTSAGYNQAVNMIGLSNGGGIIIFRICTGNDSAPTLTGTSVVASIAEFSGNDRSFTFSDQQKQASISTSPVTATTLGRDSSPGQLLVYVSSCNKSGGTNTNTLTNTLTNATRTDVINNGATAGTTHWAWGYGITTANAVADADTFSVSTTTNINNMSVAIASLKVLSAPVIPTRTLLGVGT